MTKTQTALLSGVTSSVPIVWLGARHTVSARVCTTAPTRLGMSRKPRQTACVTSTVLTTIGQDIIALRMTVRVLNVRSIGNHFSRVMLLIRLLILAFHDTFGKQLDGGDWTNWADGNGQDHRAGEDCVLLHNTDGYQMIQDNCAHSRRVICMYQGKQRSDITYHCRLSEQGVCIVFDLLWFLYIYVNSNVKLFVFKAVSQYLCVSRQCLAQYSTSSNRPVVWISVLADSIWFARPDKIAAEGT